MVVDNSNFLDINNIILSALAASLPLLVPKVNEYATGSVLTIEFDSNKSFIYIIPGVNVTKAVEAGVALATKSITSVV